MRWVGLRSRKCEGLRGDKMPDYDIEAAYPNIAEWVQGCGWIEIGGQDWQGFVVRALNEGGLIFEEDNCHNLAEAMAALEKALGQWFRENN
jgi:hypothetical protein